MTETILFTIMAIFSMIGIADFIRFLTGKILAGGKKQYLISIIPCEGHDEEIEFWVKSAYSRMHTLSPHKNCCILLVDYGMDEETREICELLQKDLECVDLCVQEELNKRIQEKFHLQIA